MPDHQSLYHHTNHHIHPLSVYWSLVSTYELNIKCFYCFCWAQINHLSFVECWCWVYTMCVRIACALARYCLLWTNELNTHISIQHTPYGNVIYVLTSYIICFFFLYVMQAEIRINQQYSSVIWYCPNKMSMVWSLLPSSPSVSNSDWVTIYIYIYGTFNLVEWLDEGLCESNDTTPEFTVYKRMRSQLNIFWTIATRGQFTDKIQGHFVPNHLFNFWM